MSDRSPSVVVTGIGLRTALTAGDRSDREGSWAALRAGRSAIRAVEVPGPWPGPSPIGAPVVAAGLGPEEDAPALALRSAIEAMADAGLDPRGPGVDPGRVATLVGLSKGGVRALGWVARRVDGGTSGVDPGAIGRVWASYCRPDAGASLVAGHLGLTGPASSPVAACATGLIAILRGAEMIRRGAADIALCGAADASIDPLILAAFGNMRALARADGGDPTRAARPWDRRRTGFVVGEGAALLVLERADHARARGAAAYAEVAGGAMGSDAHHITDLNPDPSGLADLIGRALEGGGIGASDLDYANVHGTGTRAGDPLECRAIRRALGQAADGLSCSANKGQIGHLLGAAGAAEAAITCLAIRDGFVPPTINLDDPDPACDLDGTPGVGRPRRIRAALKLSIGFGGHLAAVAFRAPDGPRRGPIDA